jgi:hypothetical protein
MYLMFADESGDPGLQGSPTRYFILCGLVVHELRWRQVMDELLAFRKSVKASLGLKLSEEIHAAHFFNKGHSTLQKHQLLEIVRRFTDRLAALPDLSLVSVVVDKHGKPANYDVFDNAWGTLLQRFENTIGYKNFPGGKGRDDRGLLFSDETDEKKLRTLVRKMRAYNPVPNQGWAGPGYRNLKMLYVIEDPNSRNSSFSYLVQAVDVCAYLLKQHLQPSSYFKSKSAQNYFLRLDPICCKSATKNHPQGVVVI